MSGREAYKDEAFPIPTAMPGMIVIRSNLTNISTVQLYNTLAASPLISPVIVVGEDKEGLSLMQPQGVDAPPLRSWMSDELHKARDEYKNKLDDEWQEYMKKTFPHGTNKLQLGEVELKGRSDVEVLHELRYNSPMSHLPFLLLEWGSVAKTEDVELLINRWWELSPGERAGGMTLVYKLADRKTPLCSIIAPYQLETTNEMVVGCDGC